MNDRQVKLRARSVSVYLLDAEVRYVNMTALTRGRLLSSFWVVDRKHIYIGSGGMSWKALSKVPISTNTNSI